MAQLTKFAKRYSSPFWELYSVFNKQAGRPLTAGETTLAQSIFGDAIDYSKVRVLTKEMPAHQASVTGNCIFIPESWDCAHDIASHYSSFEAQAVFMHEMTHIWQNQNKTHSFPDHFRTNFSRACGKNVYAYDIKEGDKFEAFGIEQQGAIVEDFFLALLMRGHPKFESIDFRSDRFPEGTVRAKDVWEQNGPILKKYFGTLRNRNSSPSPAP